MTKALWDTEANILAYSGRILTHQSSDTNKIILTHLIPLNRKHLNCLCVSQSLTQIMRHALPLSKTLTASPLAP